MDLGLELSLDWMERIEPELDLDLGLDVGLGLNRTFRWRWTSSVLERAWTWAWTGTWTWTGDGLGLDYDLGGLCVWMGAAEAPLIFGGSLPESRSPTKGFERDLGASPT